MLAELHLACNIRDQILHGTVMDMINSSLMDLLFMAVLMGKASFIAMEPKINSLGSCFSVSPQ